MDNKKYRLFKLERNDFMPRGGRKFVCDCCNRTFKKTLYGYYIVNKNNVEFVLCDDCKTRESKGFLDEFFKENPVPKLQYTPLEKHIGKDKCCSICGKYYHSEKIEFMNYSEKDICKFCYNNLIGKEDK